MKQDKYILRAFFIFLFTFLIGAYQTCEAQLIEGNYYYGNFKRDIVLSVTEAGSKIQLTIIEKDCSKCLVLKGSGEWVHINLRGVDDDYQGVEGWYDIYLENNTNIEIELHEYNARVSAYEKITVPIPNSDDSVSLQLYCYMETE